jgi:hypothetical protein
VLNFEQKGRNISTWLTEAAYSYTSFDSSGSTSSAPPEKHFINHN